MRTGTHTHTHTHTHTQRESERDLSLYQSDIKGCVTSSPTSLLKHTHISHTHTQTLENIMKYPLPCTEKHLANPSAPLKLLATRDSPLGAYSTSQLPPGCICR